MVGRRERRKVPVLGGPLQGFQDLMPFHVQDILLVSSLYDSFILQQDGQLHELILSEFLDLNLRSTPGLTHVSSGAEALALAREQPRFNLIITTINPGDMDAMELAREVKEARLDVPVVLLAYDNQELNRFLARNAVTDIDRIFLWQGNARILLSIVKYVEDKRNVAHDTHSTGVQVVLIIEDNIRFYSAFLPMIYTEMITQAHRVISEGVNLSHKILRMRARPKILLCSTFEEAWDHFTTYKPYILGIFSDIEFPKGDNLHAEAGFELARMARQALPEVPILLQSSRPEYEQRAQDSGASFLLKGSPTLLHDLRQIMIEQFSFGDFVFRLPDGREVDRAPDLKTLEEKLHTVPVESILYHGERNHFSNWLIARTEFALARRLRPRKVSDFPTPEHLRRNLIESIVDYRREQGEVLVGDFHRSTFDATSSFSRIGGGSLGGKARGLAFVRHLLNLFEVQKRYPDVRISVPPSVVLGTDVFDRFLIENGLLDFAIRTTDDREILKRFQQAGFPDELRADLAAFLDVVDDPLAVRSSSLLEDSQYQPFTGVYETFMLPNNHPDPAVRLERLLSAVKKVYASTFSHHTKAYLKATPYRLEEEKMAVILQKVVGSPHGSRFYPDFAGVARSYNFYPTGPLAAEDGITAVALGMGKAVVEGEKSLSFCPRYPKHLLQFSSVKDILENSQREFWALEMREEAGEAGNVDPERLMRETQFGLAAAEEDGTLAALGSTYSVENDAVYDGIARRGVRLVSFAPVLKHGVFPLAEILSDVLDIGRRGMSRPVEIEFAVDLSHTREEKPHFGFLQMRPLALSRETDELVIDDVPRRRVVCRSSQVLGNGKIDDVADMVVVDIHRFDRAHSREAAREVASFNADLAARGVPYLLVGVGRWGSRDPWLGIPVTWDQIAGARIIVETGFKDIRVTPSQGSHFFQNLTSFQVGYFTVNPELGEGFFDWEWIAHQSAVAESTYVRHLRFDRPLIVKMNGRSNQGIILKPGES